MVIQKKELLDSLKACMPGIETGSAVLQGADSFVFHDGKIFTYNDSISVTVPIKNDGLLEEGLEGCVKAEEFFKIISKFPADEIKFSVTEKGTWLLKCWKQISPRRTGCLTLAAEAVFFQSAPCSSVRRVPLQLTLRKMQLR